MNLENYYWYFKGAIPKITCDKIIKHANTKKEHMGVIGGLLENKLTEEQEKDLKKQRDSNITWLEDTWLYNLITPYIHTANKNSGWNFEWDWCESIQFTKYKLNQFYGWHCDSWDKAYNEKEPKNFVGKIRKLSCIVSLTDSKDYEGGGVQLDFRNKEDGSNIVTCEEIKGQGSIIIFPSFVWHQVKPVTKGTRYSLVCWTLGQKFK
tara:strand:+ start:907 stop:1527 length:621 start_codon:yes stop_codon:yes gene_type:complete